MRFQLVAATLLAFSSTYTFGAPGNIPIGQPLNSTAPGAANRELQSAPNLEAAGAAALDSAGQLARFGDVLGAVAQANTLTTRGAKETRVYQQTSGAVVLIVTTDSLGSGALISGDGLIITNWHVVGDATEVGVVFKPRQEGAEVTDADIRMATVVKTDQVTDLALLKVVDVPARAKPLSLGSLSTLPVGSDVHAIGHPTGEAWTYTKGIVSQIRRDYPWVSEAGVEHKATVIQTQTPINPGNSGGPLINDSMALVGVNSFKSKGEGLNFAVSAEDVAAFMKRPGNRTAARATAASSSSCEMESIGSGRSDDPPGNTYLVDLDCDGKADGTIIEPDDASSATSMLIDSNGDGKVDTILMDESRDGNVDYGLYDSDFDGSADLLGYFRPGESEPYKVEQYKAS